jgi:hypothetical protein
VHVVCSLLISQNCCCSTASGEERGAVAVDGKVTEDSVTKLLNAEKLPPTIPFNDKNSPKIFSSGVEKQVRAGVAVPAGPVRAAFVVIQLCVFGGDEICHPG